MMQSGFPSTGILGYDLIHWDVGDRLGFHHIRVTLPFVSNFALTPQYYVLHQYSVSWLKTRMPGLKVIESLLLICTLFGCLLRVRYAKCRRSFSFLAYSIYFLADIVSGVKPRNASMARRRCRPNIRKYGE